MAMLGTILGRLIVFSKTQVLFFDWRADIIYSLKVGGGAGMLAGIGIWIKAKYTRKRKTIKNRLTVPTSTLGNFYMVVMFLVNAIRNEVMCVLPWK